MKHNKKESMIVNTSTYDSASTTGTDFSDKQRAYIKKLRWQNRMVILLRWLILLVVLLLWEISARIGLLNDFIFSSPSRLIKAFMTIDLNGSIYYHTFVTFAETIISFLIVTVLSIALAVLLWRFRIVFRVLEPYLIVMNSLPKSALSPLLIVWLGANMRTIIVVGISIAIFGSVVNLYTAFLETDADKIKLIYTLGGNTKDALFKVVIPSAIPTILSNMKVNIGLCLVGVIIGEFLASDAGLGFLIIYGSQVFKMDWVLLSIVILCVLSIAFYGVIRLIESKIVN